MSLRKQRKTTSSIAKVVSAIVLCHVMTGYALAKERLKPLSSEEQTIVAAKPSYLQASYAKLYQAGNRNKVLSLMELGKQALKHEDISEAERAFDEALLEIESVYANNENATKARSLWHEEGRKNFKGEPYERSMAYFYRGLIYLYKNEFDNARASFLSGLMQDAFAEEEQNRSDFALMMFLAGWSSQKMGSAHLAQEAFEELKAFRPDFVPPTADQKVLVIAESGKSPRKLADGLGHYELVYRRGKKIKDIRVAFNSNGQSVEMFPMEDIYWQAASRGGRPVDSIIEGKAQFMKNASNFGSRLSNVSTKAGILSSGLGSSSGAGIGAAFSLIGVTSLAISSQTKPKADTRYWHGLPDLVHVYTSSTPQLSATKLVYQNKQGKPLFEKKPDWVSVTDKQTLVWSSNKE